MGERLLVIQAFPLHQGALGPLDQSPRLQRHLELVGQRTFELSLGRRPEQAGHHPGIGLQGADLAVVPAAGVDGIHVQGADGAAAQLDGNTQPRTDLDLDHGQGDLAPAPLHGRVMHDCWLAGGVRLHAGASGEDLLVVLQVWARSSEALAQRSRPSMSVSMTPAASASNSCLAAMTACCRVAGRSWSGCRSVRVPMLLTSIEGSIGMGVCLWVRSPNWRTRSTGQARWWPWVPIRPKQ